MPTLLELQNALRVSLVDRDDGVAAAMLAAPVAPNRLDIYRSTFVSSLTKALRLSYPAVHRLVGEGFFAATAVTDGELLHGVRYQDYGVTTQSLVMRSKSGTVRRIDARHRLDKLKSYAAIEFS